uniref:hypothetical protein n=1 Tax=Brevibacterium casei TaxID=33889 RepID=UPI0016436ADB
AEGTRGFVLTLSASAGHPYAIDPRTPLFQYHNGSPKLSHGSLARVLGIEPEVTQYGMVPPQLWTQQYCNKVAKSWIDFNSNYTSIAPKQFDKYARRLGMKLPIADAKLPTWILAPYLMHTDYFDPTEINQRLWFASKLHLDPKDDRLRRVIAASTAADLKSNALGSDEEEIVVWLDDLDEFEPSNFSRLAEYGKAIKEISESGIKPFALYGGFFSVALSTVGLTGSSHGVGFSEHRYHVDLKSSGGAPARFYVQRIHRYLPIDIASELWRQNRQLVAAYYPGYPNRDPGEYSYHELMKHSVRARSDEIHRSSHATPESIAD